MHSTVVDEKESKAHGAVIFGGCNNTLQLLNDVWTYKWPSTWSLLWPQSAEDAAKGPSPREGHAAAMGTASYSETKAAKEMYVSFFVVNLEECVSTLTHTHTHTQVRIRRYRHEVHSISRVLDVRSEFKEMERSYEGDNEGQDEESICSMDDNDDTHQGWN